MKLRVSLCVLATAAAGAVFASAAHATCGPHTGRWGWQPDCFVTANSPSWGAGVGDWPIYGSYNRVGCPAYNKFLRIWTTLRWYDRNSGEWVVMGTNCGDNACCWWAPNVDNLSYTYCNSHGQYAPAGQYWVHVCGYWENVGGAFPGGTEASAYSNKRVGGCAN